jgi:hypothetical protein
MWTQQERTAMAREDEVAANEPQLTAKSLGIREMTPAEGANDRRLDTSARSRPRS